MAISHAPRQSVEHLKSNNGHRFKFVRVDAENGSLTSLSPRLSHITFSTSCYHKFLLLLTCEIIRLDARKLAIDHGLRACNDFFINASVNDIFVNVCAEKELLNDCRVYFVIIIIIIVVSFSVLIKKKA